jgi:spore maturation protein CgeB
MRVVLFCHSLLSCWNHGNAHFLRGILRELQGLGHEAVAYEPAEGWSRQNLLADVGAAALDAARAAFPSLQSRSYGAAGPDLERALDGADLVLVHEWNPPELVAALGAHRARGGRYLLLFHDTHHRALTEADAIGRYALDGYDGVLAFGAAVREIYLRQGWHRQVWIWHEAADLALFRPLPAIRKSEDLVWIGNWGDGERSSELATFLLEPVEALHLRAAVHGVRYPETAQARLATAGIDHRGWLANHRVPEAFAQARLTVHVPRRPYAERLPGIPTIRVFEALACGIPLISAPWIDTEGLFTPGRDFLMAANGEQMRAHLRLLLAEPALRAELAFHGLATVRARHSCRHRVQELLDIAAQLAPERFAGAAQAAQAQLEVAA